MVLTIHLLPRNLGHPLIEWPLPDGIHISKSLTKVFVIAVHAGWFCIVPFINTFKERKAKLRVVYCVLLVDLLLGFQAVNNFHRINRVSGSWTQSSHGLLQSSFRSGRQVLYTLDRNWRKQLA